MTQDFSQQYQAGQTVAEFPLIVPWSGWIAQRLVQASFQETYRSHAVMLDAFSASLIWRRVILAIEADEPLLDVQQAASAAQQADALMDEWRIDGAPASSTEESARFMVWRDQYRRELGRLNALDPNLAVERVIEHIVAGLPVRATMVLAGFSEITPRMSHLLGVLQEKNVSIFLFEQEPPVHASLSRIQANTSQEEWAAAALWARSNLTQYPAGKFAIVAVSLEAEVAFARRTLSRVLSQQSVDQVTASEGFAFNVAVARPLADWQATRAVLAWLRTFVLLKQQRVAKASELGAALLAGFCVADLSESGARANVDAAWRRNQITQLNLAGWSTAIEGLTQLSPAWHLAWQAWAELPRQAPVRFWSSIFRQTLMTLGFPGRPKQSSAAYQVIEALDHLFERFDALSAVLGPVPVVEALNIFGRLARSVSFQPQRDPSARLDVLGMLEAEGGRWDGVWVLGLTDEVFPAVARPNPFVPLSELRRVGAPRATPERERQWAAHMYRQLCVLAPEMVMSAALHDGERNLRPSPFIQHIPLTSVVPVTDAAEDAAKPLSAIVALEEIEDMLGPPLSEEENVSGGVALLETQARNPLWAFMRYRLGAYGLPAYCALTPASARGMFLHRVMQNVWERLRTQAQCQHAIATGQLNEILVSAIRSAADKELISLNAALRVLEEKRALNIASAWLERECQREPFEAIQIEEKHALKVASLTLNIRLDRMDQLADGSRVVMDYKAGARLPKILNDWQRERPVNLQLPAYAAVLAQDAQLNTLAGLVLIHLHSAVQEPIGLLSRDIGLEGPTLIDAADFPDADWTTAMHRLNTVVETLAAEFSSGLACNQSWSSSDLQYCDVLALCRYFDDPQLLMNQDADMQDAGTEQDGQ